MEPSQATIVFQAKVVAVEEKFFRRWLGGVGQSASFENETRGWFVGLDGSYEFLHMGKDRPNVNVGDIATVRISFAHA